MMRQVLVVLAAGVAITAAAVTPGWLHAQAVRLPITWHRQEHALSCEVAALQMALGVQGVAVSEASLLARLPFDPTPRGGGTWGDPHQGFVGDIDGRMLVTGYGVYWEPIANLGAQYAATHVLQHGSAAQLAEQLAEGNPVIIWGYFGRRQVFSWHTPAGTPIKAINGEHTMVVWGFDGTVQAPTRFYLMDPLQGAMSWTTDELMFNWSGLNHMGVVVARRPTWVRVPGDTQVWELASGTRREVTTWEAFVRRGGSAQAIVSIDRQKLETYVIGAPI